MSLFKIMFGFETDIDPKMVERLANPLSWEASSRKRAHAKAQGRKSAPAEIAAPREARRPAPVVETSARPSAGPSSSGAVEIKRNGDKGYMVKCSIVPGKTFEAHWDTGADSCVINHAVARDHLGIRRPSRELSHDANVSGMDGRIVPAAVQEIDWTVEGILIHNVKTVILHEEKNGGSILLGMSFINKLRGTETVGDILYIYPPR